MVDKYRPEAARLPATVRAWVAECDVCFKQEIAVCRRFGALRKPLEAEGWFFGRRGAVVCASCVATMTNGGRVL